MEPAQHITTGASPGRAAPRNKPIVPKWLRWSAAAFLVLCVVLCVAVWVAMVKVKQHFHPQWVENYSVQGNQLHVIDPAGNAIPDALVVRIAAVSEPSGGWDIHSIRIPKPGQRVWCELSYGGNWNVSPGSTDAKGQVAVPSFAAHCEGERGVLGGCSENHGYFALVVYKHGYRTRVIVPSDDIPAPSTETLVRTGSGAQDITRCDSIENLVLPPLTSTDLTYVGRLGQPAYYRCHLPDGRTILQLAHDEAVQLQQQTLRDKVQKKVDDLLHAIDSGHPEQSTAFGH